MLFQIQDGTVSCGGTEVLSHIQFEIKGKEKIALVGKNGAGKTTLLRLIAGELPLDRDDKRQGAGIFLSRKLTIGMLSQTRGEDLERTVEQVMLGYCPTKDVYSNQRYVFELAFDRMFTVFGFSKEQKYRKMREFSGGEQTRIALMGLLLQKPDILLLDEPTNHLDMSAVEWLEDHIKTYEGAVVFVSHDRFFIDQTADVVYELSQHKLKRYAGNYTQYREQKQKEYEIQKKAYEKQQKEVEHLQQLIDTFKHKPKKAAFARSRKSLMKRMEMVEKPFEGNAKIKMQPIEPLHPGSKVVVDAEHVKIGYEKSLFEFSFRIRRRQKIAVIGANGSGKTALLKTIARLLPPLEGKLLLGDNTILGYLDQHVADLVQTQTVWEHFEQQFPGKTPKEIGQTLGAYLFGGQEHRKRVCDLSGGEKARLMLCELLTSKPNFLVLDEPTNHMDMDAQERVEAACKAFQGTVLVVSHDRYFVDQVADSLLVVHDGQLMYYPFGYRHYLERVRYKGVERLQALLRAEDAARIAQLRAVPKREYHETKPMSTAEASLDWALSLLRQPLEEARDQTYWLMQKKEELLAQIQELQLQALGMEAKETVEKKVKEYQTELETLEHRISQQEQEWTNCCLAYYEEWENGE